MANLYADENMDRHVVVQLRAAGHDVLTALEDGRANPGIADALVLARATSLGRAVLTGNRSDYHKLHRLSPNHAGIITMTDDRNRSALAARIDAAIASVTDLTGQLIRVIRPSRPTP